MGIKMAEKLDFFFSFYRLDIPRKQGFMLQRKNKISVDMVRNMSRKVEKHDISKFMNNISAKLFALHARLNLGSKFSNVTLVRAFVDFRVANGLELIPNNQGLSILGTCITHYFVSEYLITRWPRLPYKIIKSALWGYCGTKALTKVGREWGLETSDKEVNVFPDFSENELNQVVFEILSEARNGKLVFKRKGWIPDYILPKDNEHLENVISRTVMSIIGGIYLHYGLSDVRKFIDDHIISRYLSISSLFSFEQPGRELSVLCSREKLEPPISRLIAETGRRSSAPLFVVGVYSGNEKLGEGNGSSLKEAKYRASVDALKAWYLYESKGFDRPSKTLENDKEIYIPVHIDSGEVIV